MDDQEFGERFEASRPELEGYLRGMLVLPDAAADAAQEAAVRAFSAAGRAPEPEGEFRAWLFRIATNVALDQLRRRRRWDTNVMLQLRSRAESNDAFLAFSAGLQRNGEQQSIAREHLVFCFNCTSRNLAASAAAALRLVEVHGFTIEETAALMSARRAQVKNWIQTARARMNELYGRTCALISKQGVCHQCVELDGYFNGEEQSPLSGAADHFDERTAVVRRNRSQLPDAWHQRLMAFFEE